LAWKETYKTSKGEKHYRVAWREPDGGKRSRSFDRSKDADAFKVEIQRRSQLGELFREAPETFSDFWNEWVERYRPTVRASSFRRRIGTENLLSELKPLTFDRITPAVVEDVVTAVAAKHPRQAQYTLQTIKMVLRNAAHRGQPAIEATLRIKPPKYEARRKRFLTRAQVETLAKKRQSPRHHPVRGTHGTPFHRGRRPH
jgi:hypothetical protein